jgi:hypothetical protein
VGHYGEHRKAQEDIDAKQVAISSAHVIIHDRAYLVSHDRVRIMLSAINGDVAG